MSGVELGVLMFAVLVVLLVLRMPIGVAMLVTGMAGYVMLSGWEPLINYLKTGLYYRVSSYSLSVIPLFLLMGQFAMHAGLSRALFAAANAWLGHRPGGLAMAAVGGCAGFGAICGSSLATAATMARVALPEMRRYGYSGALATGSLAAGGTLGILIPPSVVLVIYAIIVEANIITMFMAALIPGIMAVILFLITIALYVMVRPEAGPKGGVANRAEFIAASVRVLPVLGIFGLVIGGIYFGLFNPTPAAAVGVVLVAAYGVARGAIRLPDMKIALLETARTTGMIYLILLGAELLKIFMSRGGVPQAMAEWMVNSGLAPMSILVILLVALILLGCLMDSLSMILLAIPFFWPVLVGINGGDDVLAADAAFGMDAEELKIWFGILALIVVELGLITPPVGMNVFVISAMAKDVPMRETFIGVAPFFLIELVRVAILLAFPVITLWLPRILGG